jgi:hypothetical protein
LLDRRRATLEVTVPLRILDCFRTSSLFSSLLIYIFSRGSGVVSQTFRSVSSILHRVAIHIFLLPFLEHVCVTEQTWHIDNHNTICKLWTRRVDLAWSASAPRDAMDPEHLDVHNSTEICLRTRRKIPEDEHQLSQLCRSHGCSARFIAVSGT